MMKTAICALLTLVTIVLMAAAPKLIPAFICLGFIMMVLIKKNELGDEKTEKESDL